MVENSADITICSRKYDGTVYRSWTAKLIECDDSLITLVGEFVEQITHPALGIIRRGTVSYEFYWFDRWFNIFRFHEPDGTFRNFYCNINMPLKFENSCINYVDLDIDILVWKDSSVEIIDLDEFEENAQKYSYPDNLRKKVQQSLSELNEMIKNKIFPFDYNVHVSV